MDVHKNLYPYQEIPPVMNWKVKEYLFIIFVIQIMVLIDLERQAYCWSQAIEKMQAEAEPSLAIKKLPDF